MFEITRAGFRVFWCLASLAIIAFFLESRDLAKSSLFRVRLFIMIVDLSLECSCKFFSLFILHLYTYHYTSVSLIVSWCLAQRAIFMEFPVGLEHTVVSTEQSGYSRISQMTETIVITFDKLRENLPTWPFMFIQICFTQQIIFNYITFGLITA